MGIGFDEISREAQKLPSEARLVLVERLLDAESSIENSPHNVEWQRALRARLDRYRASNERVATGPEVEQRIKATLDANAGLSS